MVDVGIATAHHGQQQTKTTPNALRIRSVSRLHCVDSSTSAQGQQVTNNTRIMGSRSKGRSYQNGGPRPADGGMAVETNSFLDNRTVLRHLQKPWSFLSFFVFLGLTAAVFWVGTIFVEEKEGELHAENALRRLNSMTLPTKVTEGCESSLIVVRHCDDLGGGTTADDGSRHCSRLGYERVQYLTSLFGTRWPYPSQLYALVKGFNARQIETLQPLSNKTGVTTQIFQYPGSKHVQDYHFEKLASGSMCGKIAVAAWKHAFVHALSDAIGCGTENGCPDEWPDSDFDRVVEVKYAYEGGQWYIFGTTSQERFDPVEYEYNSLHGA
jgi:hypothetical protein